MTIRLYCITVIPITLTDKFAQFQDLWNPRIIGELNDQHIRNAKVNGEFIWHSHPEEDELFMVVQGKLLMDFRDRNEEIHPGQLLVVPRGTAYRPLTEAEICILMIEPKSTLNTGNVESERTRWVLKVLVGECAALSQFLRYHGKISLAGLLTIETQRTR